MKQSRHPRCPSASLTALIIAAVCGGLCATPAYAQTGDGTDDSPRGDGWSVPAVIAVETAYFAASMLVLQNTWYKDRAKVPFHFYDDSRAYMQVDKFGHAFGAYVQSYVGYHLLRNAGLTNTDALLFGGTLGVIMQTPIEIMDGIHEGWGFSWGDMIANTTGSAIVVGQQLLFDEQVAVCKFSYRPSEYARNANGYFGASDLDHVLEDYNAQTYWLSVPLNRLLDSPLLPRWLSVSVGYGADGMYGEYENPREYNGAAIPRATRFRQYFLSLDIDWRRIETDSPILKAILTGLTFLKVPFPALELTSLGDVKGHWLYY